MNMTEQNVSNTAKVAKRIDMVLLDFVDHVIGLFN